MLSLFRHSEEVALDNILAQHAVRNTAAPSDTGAYEKQFRDLLQALPAAIYTTDAEGRITFFNRACIDFAGRTPKIGELWCVTWKLFLPDGTPLAHEDCPMAIALKENRPIRDVEAVAERPDGTRICFMPYPTPLRDAAGKVVGAINMLVDISQRRQAETQQRLLLDELNHRTKNNMQMLQSLVMAAAKNARSEEARRVLGEAGARIAAMAAAQRVLYGRTDATSFAADEFLRAVCLTVEQALPYGARIDQEKACGVLSNEVAMPLALILNELLTNAFKHGMKSSPSGTVRVGLTESGGQFELYVEDDGNGFELECVRETSSGLKLVLGLSRQLHGTIDVKREPSRVSLQFPAGRPS